MPGATMDLTGLGWRCAKCTGAAMVANTAGQPADLVHHFTRAELEAQLASASAEIGGGTALVIVAVLVSAISLAVSHGMVAVYAGGALAAGGGAIVHGLRRRRLLRAALREAPDARVVKG